MVDVNGALPRLVVIRGPSGSGKTTVARLLFEQAQRRICLVAQDHYRFMFRPAGQGSLPNSATIHRMIEHNVLAALDDGYDVILEGILGKASYGDMLMRLLGRESSRGFLYSFDLELDETIRRHRMRAPVDEGFTADDMRGWFAGAHPYGFPNEQLVDASSSAEATLDRIARETGIGSADTS